MSGIQNYNDKPFRFEIGKVWSGLTAVPIVRNLAKIYDVGTFKFNSEAKTNANSRQKRVQSIQYQTNLELVNNSYTSGHSFNNSNLPSSEYAASNFNNARPDHHLGEISVVNPDGNRYVYGLPVYNTLQKDVTFSVDGDFGATTGRTRTYDPSSENTTNNSSGLSNLYSSTEMPPYAHSYELTEVLSPDYVDLTGNGPSDDDLGYWVKFNYVKRDLYRWRAPYKENEGNNIDGHYSDNMDDMSGYSYGEKEIMYLESIETKTHVAEYYMSAREDGLGVLGENGGPDSEQRLLKLDKIVLKSKANLNKAIKTVHFKYNYSLCANIPNSIGAVGKLTLEKVWFTYFDNNTKGALSPYEFIYGDHDHDSDETSPTPEINPGYEIEKIDRWGNYQAVGPFSGVAPDQNYPYCNQLESYSNRDADVAAWNLTDIIMPSGGKLKINYEADDYAYVQNRPATQMFKILGTKYEGNSTYSSNLSKNNNKIYIEMSNPISQADIKNYVDGLDEIYFKTYLKLKNKYKTSTPAYDYVEGYAQFNGLYELGTDPNLNTMWVGIKNVTPGQLINSAINPIKLAGLRDIRFNRTDLLSGQNTAADNIGSLGAIITVVPTILGAIGDLMQTITGFYNYGVMNGWCDQIDIRDDFPSYIRLNNPVGKKYGGGCRVQSIDLADSWSELNTSSSYKGSSYGQVYTYTLEDGVTSSGVAEYEPLIGGEENPFRQPVRYSSDRLIIKDNALMVEEPFNENLFPSANVGYSRVTVRNKTQNDGTNDIKKSVSGITVNEFYTARDFPVYTKKTDVDYTGYNLIIPIPLIGVLNHHNNGYSQGYAIELNNMHGKPYCVATYISPLTSSDPQPGEAGVEPVAATYYYYKTEAPFVRNKPTGNKLDNNVTVLTGDGITNNTEIGKHVDTYVDMRENKTTSTSVEVLINTNWFFAIVPPITVATAVAMGMPHIDNAHSMFRSVTTNKVITRNGILDRQVTTKEGARTTTKNVYYDAETGSPLLATTTNDFDNPIYDYTYPAHWEHEGMRGAYKNVGMIVNSSNSQYVRPGDELLDLNSHIRYWIENDGGVTTAGGARLPGAVIGNLKIIRSGYRNQQSIPSGNIVSLTNPISDRIFSLFDAINNTSLAADLSNYSPINFLDCFDNTSYTIDEMYVVQDPNCNNKLAIKVPDCKEDCSTLVPSIGDCEHGG
ncbi:MAG: hypothetical protein HRT73_08985, partial [Flavobacteriales bacterium]|nr:hypothetical protein [Flavobacteriales bacterium]